MANEFRVNIGPTTSQWRGIWELTRAMKKAGFRHKASSNGSTKIVSDNPISDLWNGTMTILNTGSAASITAVDDHPYGKLLTVTGLSGLLSPITAGGRSEGNYLRLSGSATANNDGYWQIYSVISSTSCQVLNTNANPAIDTNGNINWWEYDAASEVYGTGTSVTDSTYAWIVLEGPETLQLSFTSAPSGTFVRGEPVTQTGSGATGECVGYVWESSVSRGWMVISPRTGLFNNSGTLTGSWSGVTVSPSNLYRFRRQHCFVKNASSTLTGGSWYQCVREDTESADFFSTLANNAACTATVPPGGSTTSGNRFPSNINSYVLRATNNSTNDGATALSLTDGHYDKTVEGINNTSSKYCNGRIHIGIASAIPKSGTSADGSWYLHHGNTNITNYNSISTTWGAGTLLHFGRLETADPGETELYYHYADARSDVFNRNRSYSNFASTNGSYVLGFCFANIYNNLLSGLSTGTFRAIGQRAVGSNASLAWSATAPHELAYSYSNHNNNTTGNFLSVSSFYGNTLSRVRNHPDATRPVFKEPLYLGAPSGINGKSRWIFMAPVGNAYDTLDNKTNLCIQGVSASGTTYWGIYIGPADGTTTLLQI
jgi:hypothetical protein